jgi:hypothetical protein
VARPGEDSHAGTEPVPGKRPAAPVSGGPLYL